MNPFHSLPGRANYLNSLAWNYPDHFFCACNKLESFEMISKLENELIDKKTEHVQADVRSHLNTLVSTDTMISLIEKKKNNPSRYRWSLEAICRLKGNLEKERMLPLLEYYEIREL